MIQWLDISISASLLCGVFEPQGPATHRNISSFSDRGAITVHHTRAIMSSARGEAPYLHVTRRECLTGKSFSSLNHWTKSLEMTMKTILSALVALSFLAGVVAPASAEPFSIKTLDQDNRGGHAN